MGWLPSWVVLAPFMWAWVLVGVAAFFGLSSGLGSPWLPLFGRVHWCKLFGVYAGVILKSCFAFPQATIRAEPADVESQVQPPKPSENDHQSTGPSTVSVNPSGQRTRARRERRRAVLGETSDAAEVANMDVQEMNQKSRINPQLDVSVVPNDDSGQSKASKSNVEEVEAATSTRELSCMEDIPSKKRRFTPLRPGTKTARSTALISMPQAFNPSPSRQCRHTNVSKKGCAMVCEHCGEEVLYDGWKLELCDEFDV